MNTKTGWSGVLTVIPLIPLPLPVPTPLGLCLNYSSKTKKKSVAPPDDITNSRRTTIILPVAIRPQEKAPEKFQSPLITSQL